MPSPHDDESTAPQAETHQETDAPRTCADHCNPLDGETGRAIRADGFTFPGACSGSVSSGRSGRSTAIRAAAENLLDQSGTQGRQEVLYAVLGAGRALDKAQFNQLKTGYNLDKAALKRILNGLQFQVSPTRELCFRIERAFFLSAPAWGGDDLGSFCAHIAQSLQTNQTRVQSWIRYIGYVTGSQKKQFAKAGFEAIP